MKLTKDLQRIIESEAILLGISYEERLAQFQDEFGKLDPEGAEEAHPKVAEAGAQPEPKKRPPSPQERPLKRARTIFEELDSAIDYKVEEFKPSSLFIDCLAPRSFEEARRFNYNGKRGYEDFAINDLASYLNGKKVFGLFGPSASGKSLWAKLFAHDTERELIVVQETEAEALHEYLEMAVCPRIDGDGRSRVWLCEGYDALEDNFKPAFRVLKEFLPRMSKTGIVLVTASDGYNVKTSGIEEWASFKRLERSEAREALRTAAKKSSIELSLDDAEKLLEHSGEDLGAALCSLQLFRGAPSARAHYLPPANLHKLACEGMYRPDKNRDFLLAEADADLGVAFLQEDAPLAMCAACPTCFAQNNKGWFKAHGTNGKGRCEADLTVLSKVFDACSLADATGSFWGGAATFALAGGVLQEFLAKRDGKCLADYDFYFELPSNMPIPASLYKLTPGARQAASSKRKKAIAQKFGYDHETKLFSKFEMSRKGLVEKESTSIILEDSGFAVKDKKKSSRLKTQFEMDVEAHDTRNTYLDGLTCWNLMKQDGGDEQPSQEEVDALVASFTDWQTASLSA